MTGTTTIVDPFAFQGHFRRSNTQNGHLPVGSSAAPSRLSGKPQVNNPNGAGYTIFRMMSDCDD